MQVQRRHQSSASNLQLALRHQRQGPSGRISVVHEDGDLDPVGDIELGEQAGHAGLHRGLAHEQRGGHFGVGCAGPDRGGHLTFAVGEGGETLSRDAASFRRLGVAEMGEQGPGDGRRDDRIAGGDDPDSVDDLGGRRVP